MQSEQSTSLVFVSKSTWSPPIRREHAWAMMASRRGHPVTFVERPAHIRGVRPATAYAWVRNFWSRWPADMRSSEIRIKPRSTLAPGHHSLLAERLNARLLARTLRANVGSDTSVVCSWPWDWPAVAATPSGRRVFDMADDWGELMPGRRDRFARLYARIADEADAIVVVNESLKARFPGREAVVVQNGVDETLLSQVGVTPQARTMAYIGTLTPRFDEELMRAVMSRLYDWQLELVGECMYPGQGRSPSPALRSLLADCERVRWHGPLDRPQAIAVLDRASVAVAPNRPEWSLGQDSMKLYDYAARGRPIVSTRWFAADADAPPGAFYADDPEEFAQAVVAAAAEPAEAGDRRRNWVSGRTWAARWPTWSQAVFGLTSLQT